MSAKRVKASCYDFDWVFASLWQYLETRYGIVCRVDSIRPGYFGDLNGCEIRISEGLTSEDASFTLLHLFGHTVQWNFQGPREFEPITGALREGLVAEIEEYEREACRFSLRVLLDAGFVGLWQWLSDFSAADLKHLVHFYSTGEQLGAKHFWRSGEPLLEPLDIPAFTPRVLRWRWDGVVV